VVDGTGAQRYRADVGIRDGRIARIGRLKLGAPRSARRERDDRRPGFVDLHTHYDAQLFWDPYLTLSGWHGVTSVVIGNCGFGFAPIEPDMRERAMLTMTRVEAIPYESMKQGMPWDWITYPEFLDSVDRRPKAVNVLPYVPVAPLLVWVMGFERAKAGELPTDAEHRELRRSSARRWTRRVRLVGAAAPSRRARARSSATTTAGRWSPTSCTTRPRSSVRRGARRAEPGLHADDARDRRRRARLPHSSSSPR
jgi:N-acyl-D-aspartate/D-glutamate deacylase